MTGRPWRSPVARLDEGTPLPPAEWPAASAGEDRFAKSQIDRLLGFFRRRGAGDEAGDLVQESLLRWFGAAGRQRIERPQAFLTRIAANLDKDRRKARHHAPDLLPLSHADLVAEADPIAALEARDTLRRLEAAVASLSAKNREVFLARRLDGDSYAEIAARTGLTLKGVEWRMSQAIAQIDRFLDDR